MIIFIFADVKVETFSDMKENEDREPCHYQLHGTWTSSTNKSVNYIVLKKTLRSETSAVGVYFNVDDLKQFDGVDVTEENSDVHISLVNLITEYPASEVVNQILKQFLSGLQPRASVLINSELSQERLILNTTNTPETLKIDTSEDEDNWLRQNEDKVDQEPVINVDKSSECRDCHFNFATHNQLLEHVRSEHTTQKINSYDCDKCSKSFSSKTLRLKHMRAVHHRKAEDMKTEDSQTKPTSFICPTCGEKKNSDHNLAQHIKKFHENSYPEPVVCHLCQDTKQLRNRKYFTPYSFELHMRQIHR